MRWWHAVAFAVLCPVSPLWPQSYSFQDYGQAEGLGNLMVTGVVQDRTGFLWVGTEDGLYRYDGAIFRRYGKAEGLPHE